MIASVIRQRRPTHQSRSPSIEGRVKEFWRSVRGPGGGALDGRPPRVWPRDPTSLRYRRARGAPPGGDGAAERRFPAAGDDAPPEPEPEPGLVRTHYVLCLDAACRVFPVKQIATPDEDGTPDAHAWDPVGPWDIGPERCLAGLIAADCIPRDARLGPWQRARHAEILGYWTVEVPAGVSSCDDAG